MQIGGIRLDTFLSQGDSQKPTSRALSPSTVPDDEDLLALQATSTSLSSVGFADGLSHNALSLLNSMFGRRLVIPLICLLTNLGETACESKPIERSLTSGSHNVIDGSPGLVSSHHWWAAWRPLTPASSPSASSLTDDATDERLAALELPPSEAAALCAKLAEMDAVLLHEAEELRAQQVGASCPSHPSPTAISYLIPYTNKSAPIYL